MTKKTQPCGERRKLPSKSTAYINVDNFPYVKLRSDTKRVAVPRSCLRRHFQNAWPNTRSAALAGVMAEAKRWRSINASSAIFSCSSARAMRWQVCEVMLGLLGWMRMPQSIAAPGAFPRKKRRPLLTTRHAFNVCSPRWASSSSGSPVPRAGRGAVLSRRLPGP